MHWIRSDIGLDHDHSRHIQGHRCRGKPSMHTFVTEDRIKLIEKYRWQSTQVCTNI